MQDGGGCGKTEGLCGPHEGDVFLLPPLSVSSVVMGHSNQLFNHLSSPYS